MLTESEGFVRMVLHLGLGRMDDLTEMRGSGATRVEKEDYLATCCSTVCMLLSDAVIEYEVRQNRISDVAGCCHGG